MAKLAKLANLVMANLAMSGEFSDWQTLANGEFGN